MMNTMTRDDSSTSNALAFPPIPLASGDTFTAEDGTERPIEAVTVTITAPDGTTKTVDLDFRYGGWWPPLG